MPDPIPTTVPDVLDHLRQFAVSKIGYDGIDSDVLLNEILRLYARMPGHIERAWMLECNRCGGCSTMLNGNGLEIGFNPAEPDHWAAAVQFIAAHRDCKADE